MLASFARVFIVGVTVALCSACTSVPITSLPKLAALDPISMDARKVEVAVRAPDGYSLPEGTATLVLSVWQEEGDTTYEESFRLAPVPGTPSDFLQDRAKAGFTIHRLRINPQDAPRVDGIREHMLSLKEVPGKKSLSVNVTADPCLKPGATPFKDPRIAIYLRPTQEEDYFTLIKERKVSMELPDGQLRRCEEG